MNAEIIAVGSELLTPRRVDTNSLFLTEELNQLGIEVTTKYVVGDDRERVAQTVQMAAARSEFVIISGGLGPTEDDVTREAVAQALDRKLVLSPQLLETLEALFRRFGRPMTPNNRRQAMLIEGADALANDRGTAPGQWIDHRHCSILLLPGPPHELKAMFLKQCLARVERRAPALAIRSLVLRVTGMGESDLDALIAPVYTRYSNPATTVLAHDGDLQVHLRARCQTDSEALALLQQVGSQIEILLGDKIYSRNGDPLEVVVARQLRAAQATLATAESISAGGLAARITEVPGSSDYFLGGFVTYSRKLKSALLGIPAELIEEHGPVSQEVTQAMAAGARQRTGSTYSLAVTGNAGPETDGPQAPVGMVHFALADAAGVISFQRHFPGDRERIRKFSSQWALDMLRRRLESRSGVRSTIITAS